MLDDKKLREYEIFLPVDFRPVLCYPNHKRNGKRLRRLFLFFVDKLNLTNYKIGAIINKRGGINGTVIIRR